MSNPLQTLDVTLQTGLDAVDGASSAVELEAAWNRYDGMLSGYFLSGAMSQVEVEAARAELRKAYHAMKAEMELCAQWRAEHPEEVG